MPTTALALAIQVLEALPSLVTAGEQVLALIENTVSSLKVMQAANRDPTDAEWAALDAQVKALLGQLKA